MPDGLTGLDPNFAASLAALLKAAGGKVSVYSGYRTPKRQGELYQAAVQKYGSPEAARKYVAPPGSSFHNKGQAADLRGDLELAHRLAGQYGLNFPMGYERWHIEPAGVRGGKSNVNKSTSRAPQQAVSRDPNALFSNTDLGAVLAHLIASQQAQAPAPPDPSQMYNQDAPNYPNGPIGSIVNGVPSQGKTLPSDTQQLNQKELAAQNPTNPYMIQSLHEEAKAKVSKGLAEYYRTHPAAQYQQPPEEQSPSLQQPQIPQRGQPQLDQTAAVLSSIAGLVAPRFAGSFGAAPLQAGIQQADQAYQDQIQQYKQMHDQLTQKYEAELEATNQRRLYGEKGAQARYGNEVANAQQGERAAGAALEGEASGGLSSVLAGLGASQQAADRSALEAAQIGRKIATGNAANAAKIQAYNQGLDRADKYNQAALTGGLGVLKTLQTDQTRQNIAKTTNETRVSEGKLNRQSAEGMNTKRMEAAGQRASLGSATRIAIAAMHKKIDNSDPTKLSALDRIAYQGLVSTAKTALHDLNVAENQAKRLYQTDANRPQDQSMADYVTASVGDLPAKAKEAAKKADDFYTAHKTTTPAVNAGRQQIYDPVSKTFKDK